MNHAFNINDERNFFVNTSAGKHERTAYENKRNSLLPYVSATSKLAKKLFLLRHADVKTVSTVHKKIC